MPSLYEIERAMLECVDMETGEVIFTEQLDALEMEREKKLESIALWIKNLESDVEAYKVEMESFMARRRSTERKIDGLKTYLANALGGKKFSTAKCDVRFRKSEYVEILDRERCLNWAIGSCPEALTIREPEINKTVIKKALKEGKTFPGVMLVERQNINIK